MVWVAQASRRVASPNVRVSPSPFGTLRAAPESPPSKRDGTRRTRSCGRGLFEIDAYGTSTRGGGLRTGWMARSVAFSLDPLKTP